MRQNRTYLDYLWDILNSAEAALSFVEDVDFTGFSEDLRTHFAVVRALEIVGEAATQTPDTSKERWPHIPWQDMADMRNVLIHAYSGVDLETVWRTVQEDLPPLRDSIRQILADLEETSSS